MRTTKSFSSKTNNNPYRVNQEIDVDQVRVIDPDGNVLGVLSVPDAISKAEEFGLDLVEVSPNSKPPVCKVANFGKMKYEMQKKLSDAKKKQKIIETKEVKMTINIGKGDYDVKIKHAKEFIEKGCKVKVSIRMKGREITHRDLAEDMMKGILSETSEFAKVEFGPKLEGMQLVTILISH